MTQNRFILGCTSFLIVLLAVTYIINPFGVSKVYASEHVHFDQNDDALLSGRLQSTNALPLNNIPITVEGFDQKDTLFKIASGSSDKDGRFLFKFKKIMVPVLHKHTIIILFTINGRIFKHTFTLSLDDKTFEEIFVDQRFLPFPPFTIITY